MVGASIHVDVVGFTMLGAQQFRPPIYRRVGQRNIKPLLIKGNESPTSIGVEVMQVRVFLAGVTCQNPALL